jgi:adenosylcobinamide-phosphate synthase
MQINGSLKRWRMSGDVMDIRFLSLLAALLLDRIVGDPDWLWRRFPHPVVGFGKAISVADKMLNRVTFSNTQRKVNGVIAIAILLTASLLAGSILHHVFRHMGPFGLVLEIILVAVFLAQKSLGDHVQRVADGLKQGGLDEGRKAVSMIVGRDPKVLDEAGVCRAAIESLAENFADGVVAPALWYALLGLPGLLAYKMLNTADSMIGHKSDTYVHFGWASARLDDIANWPAARLSVLLLAFGALVTKGIGAARRTMDVSLRDHNLHRSPNSGWPEAAMAGALDIRLAGPRIYGGQVIHEPMMHGSGRALANAADIAMGIRVFYDACQGLWIATGFVAVMLKLYC